MHRRTVRGPAGDDPEWAGIWIETGSSTVNARNNLVSFPFAKDGNTLLRDEGTGTVQSNNILNGTFVFIDPANASPLSRSFALAASSSDAIDKGYALGAVFEDFSGYERSPLSPCDSGAYEYH